MDTVDGGEPTMSKAGTYPALLYPLGGVKLDATTRNELFLEYENLVRWAMKKNMPLILALGLDLDDVYQDFSIAALNAIDGYDKEKSSSLATHICSRLMYEARQLKRRARPHGITGSLEKVVSFRSLDFNQNGHAVLEVPVEAPYIDIELQEMLDMLSLDELRIVQDVLDGVYHRKKEQRDLLMGIRMKVQRYYMNETIA